MPKRLTAALVRLAVVAATLPVAACAAHGSEPATSAAAPAEAVVTPEASATPAPTATPQATVSPQVTAGQPTPSPTASAYTIHLPRSFDPDRAPWQEIDDALEQARTDHEPVLIDFGAPWCPACRELQQSFQAPEAQPVVKQVHLVRVDVGPRGASVNLDIAAAYGLDLHKTGIPGMVLLSPQGRAEATTNDGLLQHDQSPALIVDFLRPHL